MQEAGAFHEVQPLCVLDFYVHEVCQRSGVGRALFAFMLDHQRQHPAALAYDRPSPKLRGFLRKHHSLAAELPQGNNFLVFRGFLQHNSMITMSMSDTGMTYDLSYLMMQAAEYHWIAHLWSNTDVWRALHALQA